MNPNYPRPKHARYLNASQFRVHEPVGMLTPTRSMLIIPRVTSAPRTNAKPLTAGGHKHKK